jgi:hypothetical protein
MLQALQYITAQLDKHLQAHYNNTESLALLGSPVSPDGAASPAIQNKVLMTLMSVDRSAAKAPISFGYKAAMEKPKDEAVIGNYTLYMLTSANFNEYYQALDALDNVISFFVANPLSEPATHPDMPAGIAKLEIAMESSDALQMRSIWLALGARYQPSVVYKITITAK